jgi:hypothetical protein
MSRYGGYIDGMGVTKMLRVFTTAVDASVERGKSEDVEDSRLGIGYGYVGYMDGAFKKGGK